VHEALSSWNYLRIFTDEATGSSRSVSLRRMAKVASGKCRMYLKWQELLKRMTKDDATVSSQALVYVG